MKTSIADLAKELARLSEAEINELGAELMKHNVSATIYRFGGVPTLNIRVGNEFDVKLVDAPRHSLLRAVKLTKEMLNLVRSVCKILAPGHTSPFSIRE